MPKIKTGIVKSAKMQKTVVVEIRSMVKHPLYKKLMKRSKKIKAHDEVGVAVGSKVKIMETRPLSKGVNYKILEEVK